MDEMLDNITLYWLTNSAGSSARFYWENTVGGMPNVPIERVELPMAASIFPREIFCPPKQWADELWPNIIHWNELDRGGHFAAFEEPKLFVEELRRAFASVRG
jgi:pimeloyl-ACP methyl ester carboxylesterase